MNDRVSERSAVGPHGRLLIAACFAPVLSLALPVLGLVLTGGSVGGLGVVMAGALLGWLLCLLGFYLGWRNRRSNCRKSAIIAMVINGIWAIGLPIFYGVAWTILNRGLTASMLV